MLKNDRLITAMITPFLENGEVDIDTAKKLAIALSKSGSDAILIGGTTGESPTLSDDEKLELFKNVKDLKQILHPLPNLDLTAVQKIA